jgi:hypothetical protein
MPRYLINNSLQFECSVQCESDLEKKLFGHYIWPAELVSSLGALLSLGVLNQSKSKGCATEATNLIRTDIIQISSVWHIKFL